MMEKLRLAQEDFDNHRQEPWKAALPQFIEHLYFKRFGKRRPDVVVSIEEQLRTEEDKGR
jgi:hypothetical protein